MNKQILIKPLITEKTLKLANTSNCFTFKVGPTANKDQIKVAISKTFGVTVKRVRTSSSQPMLKRTGRHRIKRVIPRQKKAFVYLEEGQTIDLFDLGGDE